MITKKTIIKKIVWQCSFSLVVRVWYNNVVVPPLPYTNIDGISTNDDSTEQVTLPDPPTDELPPSTQASPIILDPKQDNCSALARHLFSHVKNLHFNKKAEVADWCRSNLEIKIIWQSKTISLLISTKNCRLCAVERIAIGRHFGSKNIICSTQPRGM